MNCGNCLMERAEVVEMVDGRCPKCEPSAPGPAHGPGPWIVHRDAKGRGYEIESRPPGDRGIYAREICRINSRRQGAKRGQSVRWFEHPDDAANAYLLAAAPDLLAVLRIEEALDLYETPGNGFTADELEAVAVANGYPHRDNLVGLDRWVKEARRAALERAQGPKGPPARSDRLAPPADPFPAGWCAEHRNNLTALAHDLNAPVADVIAAWKQYSEDCTNRDQSALFGEFKQWIDQGAYRDILRKA